MTRDARRFLAWLSQLSRVSYKLPIYDRRGWFAEGYRPRRHLSFERSGRRTVAIALLIALAAVGAWVMGWKL